MEDLEKAVSHLSRCLSPSFIQLLTFLPLFFYQILFHFIFCLFFLYFLHSHNAFFHTFFLFLILFLPWSSPAAGIIFGKSKKAKGKKAILCEFGKGTAYYSCLFLGLAFSLSAAQREPLLLRERCQAPAKGATIISLFLLFFLAFAYFLSYRLLFILLSPFFFPLA